jgi:hypothetical protein
VIVTGVQPETIVAGTLTVNATVTFVVYQPVLHAEPLHDALIATSARASEGTRNVRQMRAAAKRIFIAPPHERLRR